MKNETSSIDNDFQVEEDVSVEEKLKKLREKLKKCQKEKEEYLDGWQRSKADFINTRKKEEEERKNFIKMSNEAECANCGFVGEFGEGWYEVDDGDLCPECAKMLDYDERLDD